MARPLPGVRGLCVVLGLSAAGERDLSRCRSLDAHVHSQCRAQRQVLIRSDHPGILHADLEGAAGADPLAVAGRREGRFYAVISRIRNSSHITNSTIELAKNSWKRRMTLLLVR